MKHKISRILCTALCCAPLLASAQTSEKSTSPKRLYQEGQTLFQQKAYAAAISPLQAYVCLLYTSVAADDLLFEDLGGPLIIPKKRTLIYLYD